MTVGGSIGGSASSASTTSLWILRAIEVNRRARQAKTDRLDADKLLAMLIRHHAGERVWSVLREPSRKDEDARREHRELQRLAHERIAHTNRIGSIAGAAQPASRHRDRGGGTGPSGGTPIATGCRRCRVPSLSGSASA